MALASHVILVLGLCQIKTPRMVVVPNDSVDIYTRLWCVYEMFVATWLGIPIDLAPTIVRAGETSSQDAVCSVPADAMKIRREIEASIGYDAVDASIRRVMHHSRWNMVSVFLRYIALHILPFAALECLQDAPGIAMSALFSALLTYGFAFVLMYLLARWLNGKFTASRITVAASLCYQIVYLAWLLIFYPLLDATGGYAFLWSIDLIGFEMFLVCFMFLAASSYMHIYLPRIPTLVAAWIIFFIWASIVMIAEDCKSSQCWAIRCLATHANTLPMYMIWTEGINTGIKIARKVDKKWLRAAAALSFLMTLVQDHSWFVHVATARLKPVDEQSSITPSGCHVLCVLRHSLGLK
eukprot:TRINITY_DN10908_c0_g3_i1.p1 TRINITY_DN10908_c0_g3~~TRINITY_DN10908_c0_g3_i1.p1  ORF type:complete len:391 (-),score=36.22 TRINITY_DN10908_c0_g3_i1:115-1173(-)